MMWIDLPECMKRGDDPTNCHLHDTPTKETT